MLLSSLDLVEPIDAPGLGSYAGVALSLCWHKITVTTTAEGLKLRVVAEECDPQRLIAALIKLF